MNTDHNQIEGCRGADHCQCPRSKVMTPSSYARQRRPISERRDERELFFWTATMTLRLVAAVACTAYLVVALAHGEMPAVDRVLDALTGGR